MTRVGYSRSSSPRTGGHAAAAVAFAILSSASVAALEMPPIGGMDPVGEDEKKFSVEAAFLYGSDSNVARAPSGSDESDTVTEMVVGISCVDLADESDFEDE